MHILERESGVNPEEFTPPQDEPYIIVKEYDLTKAGNSITCQDGSFDLSDVYGEEA